VHTARLLRKQPEAQLAPRCVRCAAHTLIVTVVFPDSSLRVTLQEREAHA